MHESPAGHTPLKTHVLVYGLVGAALIVLLRAIEYRYLMIEYSAETYGALIAVIFACLGIWLGYKLSRPKETVVHTVVEHVVMREVTAPIAAPFAVNTDKLAALNITPREQQILTLIASGLSNREIAERVFVSENTIKTHSRHLFDKLGARRRTQAVQLAKDFGLLP